MAKQIISTGSAANDGNGDTLRSAGIKINDNFSELYSKLGDGNDLSSQVSLGTDGIIFEGSTTGDTIQTTLKVTDPTSADKTITLPDANGNVILDTATQTITNKNITMTDMILDNTDISSGGNILSNSNPYIRATGASYGVTLDSPSGTDIGKMKVITYTGTGTLTVTIAAGGSFNLSSSNQTKILIWNGTNWLQLT